MLPTEKVGTRPMGSQALYLCVPLTAAISAGVQLSGAAQAQPLWDPALNAQHHKKEEKHLYLKMAFKNYPITKQQKYNFAVIKKSQRGAHNYCL